MLLEQLFMKKFDTISKMSFGYNKCALVELESESLNTKYNVGIDNLINQKYFIESFFFAFNVIL